MKNIQVIDGAANCTFPVYSVADDDFNVLFPKPGQNVEFVQDLAKRLGGDRAAGAVVQRATAKHVSKADICGIHGTLFVDLPERRKYFPNKREEDVFVP